MRLKKTISIFWLLCLASLSGVELTATLSQKSVAAGEGVQLTVTMEGASPDAEPSFPKVENLIISPRGTSRQMRYSGGDVSRTINYNFVVGSHVEGEYLIPSIILRVDGKGYQTQALKLKVGPAAQGADDDEKPEKMGKFGHLDFQMLAEARKYLYPGEIAPVKISAYFPADARVSLTGPPRPEGSAFTLHHLSEKPEQKLEVIDGKRTLVVTWFGGLSATKAGNYPASFKLAGTVAVRDNSAKRRPSGFDDSFFGGSMLEDFFAPMVQKEVELTTEEASKIEVKELPTAGRPKDFTGAIGQFEFESVRIPGSLRTGEPTQIEAVVTGSGNFSLLTAPHPIPQDSWKIYDGKNDFLPEDEASFGGKKTFRYNAVPLKPGEMEVALGFSYFDPEKGEYREARSELLKLSITGEAVKPAAEAKVGDAEKTQSVGPQIAPLNMKLGAVRAYESLSENGWFAPALGACGISSLAILALAWLKKRADDPENLARQASEEAAKKALTDAENAVAAGDAPAFFKAAKSALQLALAKRDGLKPEAITPSDFGAVGDDKMTAIFAQADRMEYSGKAVPAKDLERWKQNLDECLARLAENGKERAA